MIDYNTYLQTVAAISSAIAAIAAVCVAKSTITFQKNSLLKKASIEKMLTLLQQLQYLKSLTGQALIDAADEAVTELPQRISETMDSVKTLESMISATASTDFVKLRDSVGALRETNFFTLDENTPNVTSSRQLTDAISALQNIYRREIK